jgi:DNA repair exonuclease SbcCD ATPase subunit
MKLDCCDGHLCKKCFESVKKKFTNCPLCRQSNFTAKFSRLMVTVLSQYKLFCPAEECNESVPYAEFSKHKKTCPALNKKPCPLCKKLYWKNNFLDHFICFEELNRKAEASHKNFEMIHKSLTQSKEALSQNNKNLMTVKRQNENKIAELERNLAQNNKKIQNQRNNLSMLNKKISDSAKNGEKKQKYLDKQLKASVERADLVFDRNITLNKIVHEMSGENERLQYEMSFKEISLNSANQEITRLTEELNKHKNKVKSNIIAILLIFQSSGFLGFFG